MEGDLTCAAGPPTASVPHDESWSPTDLHEAALWDALRHWELVGARVLFQGVDPYGNSVIDYVLFAFMSFFNLAVVRWGLSFMDRKLASLYHQQNSLIRTLGGLDESNSVHTVLRAVRSFKRLGTLARRRREEAKAHLMRRKSYQQGRASGTEGADGAPGAPWDHTMEETEEEFRARVLAGEVIKEHLQHRRILNSIKQSKADIAAFNSWKGWSTSWWRWVGGLFVGIYPAIWCTLQLPDKAMWVLWALFVYGTILRGLFVTENVLGLFINRARHQRQGDVTSMAITFLPVLNSIARYLIRGLGIILGLDLLGFRGSSLLAGMGIGGVAIAFAAQSMLADLLSTIALYVDQPFVVGDFVTIKGFKGVVEHIGFKTTRLMSESGEALILSNSSVSSSEIVNTTACQMRRCILVVPVSRESVLGIGSSQPLGAASISRTGSMDSSGFTSVEGGERGGGGGAGSVGAPSGSSPGRASPAIPVPPLRPQASTPNLSSMGGADRPPPPAGRASTGVTFGTDDSPRRPVYGPLGTQLNRLAEVPRLLKRAVKRVAVQSETKRVRLEAAHLISMNSQALIYKVVVAVSTGQNIKAKDKESTKVTGGMTRWRWETDFFFVNMPHNLMTSIVETLYETGITLASDVYTTCNIEEEHLQHLHNAR